LVGLIEFLPTQNFHAPLQPVTFGLRSPKFILDAGHLFMGGCTIFSETLERIESFIALHPIAFEIMKEPFIIMLLTTTTLTDAVKKVCIVFAIAVFEGKLK
jgi:hypothetical protein